MADPPLLGPAAPRLPFLFLILTVFLVVVLCIVDHILSEHQPRNVQQADAPELHMQKLGNIDILELDPHLLADGRDSAVDEDLALAAKVKDLSVCIGEKVLSVGML